MRREVGASLHYLYDAYRTALLNRKYYADRLVTRQRWNLALEVILAVGTSGTIGGWAIWKQGVGPGVWAAVAGFVALIAILKPLLQLSKAIERYSKLFIGYTELHNELQRVVLEVQTCKTLTDEMWRCFQSALTRHSKLALEDDARPAERLRRRCYDEVNREIPPSELWMPEAALKAAVP